MSKTHKFTTRMSSKERKSMIVDAVLSIADVDGPDRLSTIEIAKASGLTHAGIFRHFPTKKDIWIAVANEIAIRAKTHWQEPLLSNNAPREKVEILVGSHFEFLTETPAILTILFSYELQHANAQLREILTKLMLEFRKHLADEFTRAKYDKSEAMDLAFLIIALVQGLAMRWAVSQRKFNLEKEGKRLLKVQLDLISFSK